EKWLETRQLISKTRSDWQSDKEIMDQTIALYERELKSLEEQMSKVSTNNTQVEKERLETEALQKSSNDALNSAKEFAAGFEAQVQKLVPQMPAPLQDILKKDLDRITADQTNNKMLLADRVQTVVGTLNDNDIY